MIQGRLCIINSASMQISIQSTKNAMYNCSLNNGSYFPCGSSICITVLTNYVIEYVGNDGDVITDLPPANYILMVETSTSDDPQSFASDTVGPVSLTEDSTACKYNKHHQ